MRDLREEIAQRIERRFYMFCKDKTIARHASCDVLAISELQSIIEKAEKYDKLFGGLGATVESEGCNGGRTHSEEQRKGHEGCLECDNNTGKIYRSLTDEEKDEAINILVLIT